MNIHYDDTIAAPATLPGTGAISIIRISGPQTFDIIDRTVKFKKGTPDDFPGYSLHYGTVCLKDGSPLDDVIVSIFRAPHSYTGEDSAEISFHASKYIAGQLMFLLLESGARTADPGEFTRRAYENGRMDLAQAESVADIISSQNAAAHRLAFNQLRGGFSKELMEMRSELLNMVSLMELELDFSEEDVEFADRSQLNELLDKVSAHIRRLTDSFRLGNAIRNGIPVSIVGAANSGKSTLLNALLGEERAIVSDIPGTTRDTVEETFNIDGVGFRLIDTAGIRDTSETIEKIGIERSLKKLSEADIILGVIDGSASENSIWDQAEFILSKCDFYLQKLVLILNKKDLLEDVLRYNKNVTIFNNIVSHIDNKDFISNIRIVSISAATGEGIEEIKGILSDFQPEIHSGSDVTLVTNARHFDALVKASGHLNDVRIGLASSLPTDLIAQDLRSAIDALSSITGMSITTDELLENIFRNFCIGK